MKDFTSNHPTQIIYGTGKIKELARHITAGVERVLLVTDKNVAKKSGALDKIMGQLRQMDLLLFDEVEENPSFDLVHKGAQLAKTRDVQLVIGLGGGSPMDAAKGCALLASNSGAMRDYIKGKSLQEDPLPVICVPTSSGTGSEVTPYVVFSDPEKQSKEGFAHPLLFPYVSIIDPELTYSMPQGVIINTGLDALTHSLEAYLSSEANQGNDEIALHSLEIVLENLEAASLKNKEAMNRMSYAAMIAGIAITNAGTILLHIMAYPLTVFHHIPHGKANAILLPAFLQFMKEKSTVKDKISQLEKMFGKVGGIENFLQRLNISTRLSAYGVKESQLKLFAEKTIIKSDIAITPAHITETDIVNIYRSTLD